MNLIQRIQRTRAIAYAKRVDRNATRALAGNHVRPATARVDVTAPTMLDDGSIERKPLAALGHVVARVGRSNGTIATPSSYKAWLAAGKPTHPIYNAERFRIEHYVDGIALPTSGAQVETPVKRHERDCACCICSEYRVHATRAHVQPSIAHVEPRVAHTLRVLVPLRFPISI